jgi:hypothetical protein
MKSKVNRQCVTGVGGSAIVNPLTSDELQRRRKLSSLKIKFPSKNVRENQQKH